MCNFCYDLFGQESHTSLKVKCIGCGKDVEVKSKSATRVKCVECSEKKGFVKGKRDYDTDDFIYCRECGDVKKRIGPHLTTCHQMTEAHYKEKYPDAPLYAKNTIIKKRSRDAASRAKTSIISKRSWQNQEFREKQIERLKLIDRSDRKPLTDEQKQHLKDGQNSSLKMAERRNRGKIKKQLKYDQERKEKQEMVEYVLCPLCIKEGKDEIDARFRFIAPYHLSSHGYSNEQFYIEYPDFKFKTDEMCDEHSACISGKNHFNYGKHLDEEVRDKISRGMIGWYQTEGDKKCIRCNTIYTRDANDICSSCLTKLYGFSDTYELVYCRICSRTAKNLTAHIFSEHKLTVPEYKKLYGAEVISQQLKDDAATVQLGVPNSIMHNQAIIQYQQGKMSNRIEWEENFKREDYNYLFNRKKPVYVLDSHDYVYCRYCLKWFKFVSPEHLFVHKLTSWMYRQLFPDAPIIASSVVNRVISKGIDTKIRLGIRYGAKSYGFEGYRKDLDHYTRSMIEANFCRILKYNKVAYEYESTTFKLKHDIFSSYTPDIELKQDFHVWKAGSFLEIKNDLSEKNIIKMQVFSDQYPSVIIHIIERRSFDEINLERRYKNLIDMWETSERNIVKTPELY